MDDPRIPDHMVIYYWQDPMIDEGMTPNPNHRAWRWRCEFGSVRDPDGKVVSSSKSKEEAVSDVLTHVALHHSPDGCWWPDKPSDFAWVPRPAGNPALQPKAVDRLVRDIVGGCYRKHRDQDVCAAHVRSMPIGQSVCEEPARVREILVSRFGVIEPPM